jgi:hypothetical protein
MEGSPAAAEFPAELRPGVAGIISGGDVVVGIDEQYKRVVFEQGDFTVHFYFQEQEPVVVRGPDAFHMNAAGRGGRCIDFKQ